MLGAWPVLHISLLVMNRLNKTEFAIFISLMWSLLPKALTNLNLFLLSVFSAYHLIMIDCTIFHKNTFYGLEVTKPTRFSN